MDLRVAKQCSPAFRFYGIWACDQDQLNATKRGKHAQIGTLPNQSPMTFLVMQLWFWGWTRRPLGRHAISAKGPQFVGDGDSVGWNFWGEKLTPRICLIFFWGLLNCRGLFWWWIGAFAHWGTFMVKTLCPKGTAFNMDGLPFLATSMSHSHIFCFQY